MNIELIEPSAEIMKVTDPYKKIEICGRTCYKSSSPLTDETAREFYQMLLKKQHYAMLEHATFVFELTGEDYASGDIESIIYKWGRGYLNYTCTPLKFGNRCRVLVSGNLRALIESSIKFLNDALLKKYPNIFESIHTGFNAGRPERVSAEIVNLNEYSTLTKEEVDKHRWSTFLITTDRGVSHEIVRHRPVSYAQESTRYVNYTKFDTMYFIQPPDFNEWTILQKQRYQQALYNAANDYEYLIKRGLKAQQARGILPHEVKTDIIMTTYDAEWQHFFDLRYRGTTGAPHPNMKQVASIVYSKWLKDYVENYGYLVS